MTQCCRRYFPGASSLWKLLQSASPLYESIIPIKPSLTITLAEHKESPLWQPLHDSMSLLTGVVIDRLSLTGADVIPTNNDKIPPINDDFPSWSYGSQSEVFLSGPAKFPDNESSFFGATFFLTRFSRPYISATKQGIGAVLVAKWRWLIWLHFETRTNSLSCLNLEILGRMWSEKLKKCDLEVFKNSYLRNRGGVWSGSGHGLKRIHLASI